MISTYKIIGNSISPFNCGLLCAKYPQMGTSRTPDAGGSAPVVKTTMICALYRYFLTAVEISSFFCYFIDPAGAISPSGSVKFLLAFFYDWTYFVGKLAWVHLAVVSVIGVRYNCSQRVHIHSNNHLGRRNNKFNASPLPPVQRPIVAALLLQIYSRTEPEYIV